MTRRKLALLLILLTVIILTASAVLGVAWYNDAIYNPSTATDAADLIEIDVQPGQTLLEIAPELEQQAALKSVNALRIYLRLNPTNLNLLKGKYQLPKNLTVPALLEKLAEGPKVYTVKAAIPEALRDDEVIEIIYQAFLDDGINLNKQKMLDIVRNPDSVAFSDGVQSFLDEYKPAGKPLEGFLFPDTYVFGADATEQQLIELLVSTMQRRLDDAGITASSHGRLQSFYEVLTLASIVEREANLDVDRKKVADIFLRRLETGWQLGSDVCLLYKFKDWRRELTNADLADSSNPYNTRLLPGLTPTPIANPGLSGIQAVLEPTANNYYYFIAGADGNTYYAVTLSEHYQNIANHM